MQGASKVVFGVPIVLSESSVANPKITGSAANGGELVPTKRASDALMDLVVTYSCQQEGETPITVRIPTIEPAGTVTFSVLKTCSNPGNIKDSARRGVSVPGLMAQVRILPHRYLSLDFSQSIGNVDLVKVPWPISSSFSRLFS